MCQRMSIPCCAKNSAQLSLEHSFCPSLASERFSRKALQKLSGSASARRTRICFKSTNASKKRRSPLASAYYDCALSQCRAAIAAKFFKGECRPRCGNDPRRGISSLFERTDSRGANSYACDERALSRIIQL